MWPTSVAIPVAVTTKSPEPRVTLVFMYTMSVRSPSGVSACATGTVPFDTGRLSPVSADSATSSVAARSSRPSAGTMSPASIGDDVAGDQLLGAGAAASSPSRVTLALMIIIFCSAATAAAALPSWRRPSTALNRVSSEQQDAGLALLERVQAHDAGDQQHDLHRVGVLPQERVPRGSTRAAANRFGPNRCARAAASAALRPRAAVHPLPRRTSSAGSVCHTRSTDSAGVRVGVPDETPMWTPRDFGRSTD